MKKLNSQAMAVAFLIFATGYACFADARSTTLRDADRHIEAFRLFGNLDELRLAKTELGSTSVKSRSATNAMLLRTMVSKWLTFFSALDSQIDPTFNPNDPSQKVSLSIVPPREANGVELYDNAPVSSIKDPIARAKYQQEIARNRARITRLNRQVDLRNLSDESTYLFGATLKNLRML